MKKLTASGYVSAEDSRQPGYLAGRFKRMQAEQRARERAAAEQEAANAAEAQAKTIQYPRARSA